jgi:hypothetical protein
MDRHVSRGWIGRALPDIDEDLVAEIYEWLAEHRPLTAEDAPGTEQREPRAQMLNGLVKRGTASAVVLLDRLQARFPSDQSLQFRVPEARRRLCEETWIPPEPSELAALAADNSKRLVTSGRRLLDLVLEALRAYEKELHGETPAVMDLWSYRTSGSGGTTKTYWPKDEPDFSDHIKRHLARRLKTTVVNREVELRPTEGERTGEYPDLLVQAIDAATQTRFTVVVEVKCAWNKDLETALESQLVARYLEGGGHSYGLYVVGWHECADWDGSDSRRATCRRRDRASIEATLRAQATAASKGERRVEYVGVDASIR